MKNHRRQQRVNLKFRFKALFSYTLRARHKRGFGIHSPYVFAFVNDVIFENNAFYAYSDIEDLRQNLLHDKTTIAISPIGTSTKTSTTIAHEAATSSKPRKYAQLLLRLAVHNESKTIIELGTNLGLSTLYLSSVNSDTQVYTIEGQKNIAQIAEHNFKALHRHNIHLIIDNIDTALPSLINSLETIDLLYIDANHRYNPTIQYYSTAKTKIRRGTIFVIDDPHWSPEMQQAWEHIKTDPEATITLDLFGMGIVIFNDEIPKQHYTIKF